MGFPVPEMNSTTGRYVVLLEPELELDRERSSAMTFPSASDAAAMKLRVLEKMKKLPTSMPNPTALKTPLMILRTFIGLPSLAG
jgi:hypothetical protein